MRRAFYCAQSVEITNQLAGEAKASDQQMDHLVVEQERVWQVLAASQPDHFQIWCRWIATFKTVRH